MSAHLQLVRGESAERPIARLVECYRSVGGGSIRLAAYNEEDDRLPRFEFVIDVEHFGTPLLNFLELYARFGDEWLNDALRGAPALSGR